MATFRPKLKPFENARLEIRVKEFDTGTILVDKLFV